MLRGVRVVLFVFVNKKSNHYSEHVFQGSSSRCVVKFLGVITAYQVSLRRNSFSTAEVLGRCQNCLTWHSCTVCVFTLFVPLCCIVFTCQTHLCGAHPNRLPTASSTTNTGKCSENTFMLYNLSCLLLNTSANPLSSKFLRQSENCCLLRKKKGREKKKRHSKTRSALSLPPSLLWICRKQAITESLDYALIFPLHIDTSLVITLYAPKHNQTLCLWSVSPSLQTVNACLHRKSTAFCDFCHPKRTPRRCSYGNLAQNFFLNLKWRQMLMT